LGLATAELSFERDADHVVADLCLVGTASEMAGTFLWAWANDAIPAGAKLGLDAVRSFGTTHDLPLLTTPEWPGGRAEGLEMLAIAGRVQDATGGFVVPTFLVADVGATARWYAETLGFRIAGTVPAREPYVYASLQRDGVELMLLGLAGYQKPDLTAPRPVFSELIE
jgi:hypothetical protein